MKDVTVLITTCGRQHLFIETLNSFIKYNTYPIYEFIVTDNSVNCEFRQFVVSSLEKTKVPYILVCNSENIGQVASLDRAYQHISTPYIFHLEDDWMFYRSSFIEESMSILEFDAKIVNVNLRDRFGIEASSQHPVSDPLITSDGVSYREYITHYKEIWHGFSWNPGLRRLQDYKNIQPFKQYVNEQGVGQKYFELGYRSASLDNSACFHIGIGSSTFRRNE